MENTKTDISIEKQNIDKTEEGSNFGFFVCIFLFLSVFFAVIIVQMYSLL